MHSASALEGVSRTHNALINGDYKNYDWVSGYTCHQLGSSCISTQLAQLYVICSMRLLLWDCDNRSTSYCIETSLEQSNWTRVTDKRNEACRSWQMPISFIKITGTHNTANEVFNCVHFEWPCNYPVLENEASSQHQLAQPAIPQQQTWADFLWKLDIVLCFKTTNEATIQDSNHSKTDAVQIRTEVGEENKTNSLIYAEIRDR